MCVRARRSVINIFDLLERKRESTRVGESRRGIKQVAQEEQTVAFYRTNTHTFTVISRSALG